MTLDLGICNLRPWQWGDERSLARHANNREVWRNLRDTFPSPYSLQDAMLWIARSIEVKPHTNFAIAIGDEVVGGIGLVLGTDVERRSAEIGYWLGEAHWGKGIVTAAVEAVTQWGFGTFDIVRIYAGVYEWNPASARVLEKAGYVLEGRLHRSITKDGKTIDRLLYACIRHEQHEVDLPL